MAQINDSRIKGGQQLKLTFEKAGYRMLENLVFAAEGSFNLDAALLKVEATKTKAETIPSKRPFNWLPMIIGGGALLIILIVCIVAFMILSRPGLPIDTIARSDVNGKHASEFLDTSHPGIISLYAGIAAPSGWLMCDGSQVSRTTYPDLFAVIGVTYGAGDGINTFNLPDLRQRFPLGKADTGTGSTLGGNGGAIDHTHYLSSKHLHHIPSHSHSFTTNSAGSHDHGGYTGHEEDSGTIKSRGELLFTAGRSDHHHSISTHGEHKHTGNTDSLGDKTGYSNI